MDQFDFYAPTYFAFGEGQESRTGELVRRFGGTKVLLHFGGGSIKRNGVYDAVTASLRAADVAFVELGGVQPNPRSGLVYEGIALCRKEGVDFVLAVGGGSTIDSAKAIAQGVPYEGDFWDFYGKKMMAKQVLPVGTVLTIAAAGSEGSPNSVITHEDGMLKWSNKVNDLIRPKFSILNPAYTCSLPPYQTASGVADIMAHICERYFTNTCDVEVTDRLCEALLKTVIEAAPKALAQPDDMAARANIMWTGMLAHNNTCGVGRVQDWGSHALEHELSSLYDCAHGAGLAVIMPAWMDYVCDHDVARFAQFAVRVWGCDMDFVHPQLTAREGIARFRGFLASLGMPVTFAQLGAKEADIPQLLEHLAKKNVPHEGNFVPLQPADIEAIYRIAAKN